MIVYVCASVCVYIRNTLVFGYLFVDCTKIKTQRAAPRAWADCSARSTTTRVFFVSVFWSWLSGFGFVTYRRSTRRVSDADINSDSDAEMP